MINNHLPSSDGEVAILNVGDGDTKLSFDPNNPMERIRAARIVKDMLRRGYALMILIDGKYQRAHDFDESVCEYIIADFDPITAAEEDAKEEQGNGHQQGEAAAAASEGGVAQVAPARRRRKARIPAEGTRAVAVGRISGG